MDNALLKQLIEQHRRVVIPDFGAFLKKESPEGESLVFSPFLRKDDGMVTDALVQEYGVETDDARAMVGEFVIYLRQSLASTGRYYIEGVGMLKADANGTVTLVEGETPEPETVEPEPIPEPKPTPTPVQPIPQQVQQGPATTYTRPVQPTPAPVPTPTPMPGMTRPQSIQVQAPVPPVQQIQQTPPPTPPVPPVQQMPLQTGSYTGVPPMPMNGGYVQRGAIPGQQPYPPVPPAGQQPLPGQMSQRNMQQPPLGGQPTNTPPAMRGGQQPVPGQMPQRNMQQPMGGGAPSMRGGQAVPMGGGNVPPRGPQEARGQRMNPQGGNNGRGPGNPGGPNAKAQQGQRRPMPPKRKQPKTKTDIWLIVAIIAALIVIAIMVYGFINTGHGDLDMEMINANMAPIEDTVTIVVPDGGESVQ